jgi:diaminopimelate epimerase
MTIVFNKYQGAGNDFIIIDNRKGRFNPSDSGLIKKLCDRRFGIGADGLILIKDSSEYNFEMQYFNSDGFEGSMCGNGGRCSADFALKNGITCNNMIFRAIDGTHKAISDKGIIRLQMNDVKDSVIIRDNYFINTGSPHYVIFKQNIDNIDVYNEGKRIRLSKDFAPGGTNVNFVEVQESGIYVRTFERGVEDETLACGTGVTASAIATALTGTTDKNSVDVRTRGGNLNVEFNIKGSEVTDIWLSGPATFVYEGEIDI